MQQERRSKAPLIDPFLEPERAFNRTRREHKKMADKDAEMAEMRRQLEEMRLTAQPKYKII